MCYDANAPQLVARGYHPLPTAPVGFEPKKAPVKWSPAFGRFTLYPDWNNQAEPLLTPQPGANIGVRCGDGLVALDFDDDDAALLLSEVFDVSVSKTGQRAFSSHLYADFDVPSEDFYDANGKKVVQVLSRGRQTVIPPSINPDTGKPYYWTNGKSLYNTPKTELPPLPRDYRERIMKLGYAPKRAPEPVETIDPETGEIQNGFDDSPHREINAVALKNLSAWVPALNLYKCHRRVGRYANYEAVATWRESTTGRPLEERAPNLRISSQGIRDFGDGRGYSALDLVMAARSSSLAEALCWLEEKLLPPKPDIEIDLEKIVEAQDAPKTAPEDDGANNSEEHKADEQPKEEPKRRRKM